MWKAKFILCYWPEDNKLKIICLILELERLATKFFFLDALNMLTMIWHKIQTVVLNLKQKKSVKFFKIFLYSEICLFSKAK